MKIYHFDLILFDLDGTSIDTASEICAALNDTLSHYSLATYELNEVRQWIGHGAVELLYQALAQTKCKSISQIKEMHNINEYIEKFRYFYLQNCGTTSTLFPGFSELLSKLKSLNKKCVMLTNKEKLFSEKLLNAHQIYQKFDMVICGDTFPRKKPDPYGIEQAMLTFNISKDKSLMIGDSSVDVLTARNAEIEVWAASYGYNMGKPIADSNPDLIFDSFVNLS